MSNRYARVQFETEIRWDWIFGRIACVFSGHRTPNVLGDCPRCGTDIEHLPDDVRLVRAQRLMNEHMRQHSQYALLNDE